MLGEVLDWFVVIETDTTTNHHLGVSVNNVATTCMFE